MEMNKCKEIIREKLTEKDFLLQLAEECSELNKAALKMVRIIEGRNPTPVTMKEAGENIVEEAADVQLCLNFLMGWADHMEIYEIQKKKTIRWAERLEGMEHGNDLQ